MNKQHGDADLDTPRLIGYARTSDHEPFLDMQIVALRSAGCDRIFEEETRTSQERRALTRLLAALQSGDVLVVTALDRVAQSAGHLLELVADLQRRGVHFRSLGDPIDTTSPQLELMLAVLRSAARLDGAVRSERTRVGIKVAQAQGKLLGNPGLREKRPEAIKAVSEARDKLYLDELVSTADTWLPVVQRLRPQHSWDNVVLTLNRQGQSWTGERLRRAVHRMVREQRADADLLARSPRRAAEDRPMKLVAAVAIADPGLSLRQIATQLDQMGESPTRGGRKWQASSIRHLLNEAYRFGLIPR